MDRLSSQGTLDQDDAPARAKEEPKATRTANPMSFSSILSSNVPDPQKSAPSSKPLKSSSNTPSRDIKPSRTAPRKSAPKRPASPKMYLAPTKHVSRAEPELLPPVRSLSSSKHKSGTLTSDKENERVKKEMAKIDAIPPSPIHLPEYEADKQKHAKSSQKRQRDVENGEEVKRKACRPILSSHRYVQANLSILAPSHRYMQDDFPPAGPVRRLWQGAIPTNQRSSSP